MVRACHRGGRAVGGARRRLGPVRRRAAGRGGRADRAVAAAADPRGRPARTSACVVEPGVTNIAVSQAVAPDALLPARPVEPDRLHDRRQRGRELRRRALLQVRLHDQLRDRARGGAARRRRWCSSAARSSTTPGYDLLGAFVGSEGTLGVATKIWLRVIPKPEAVRTLVAFFGSTVQAGRGGVRDRGRAGSCPGAIEMMDNLSIQAAEGATNAGYPHGRRRGARGGARRLRGRVRGALRAGRRSCERDGATAIRVAEDEAERDLIWRARKAAFAAMGRIAPNYYVQDSVIPRTRLAEVLGQIEELAARVTTSRWRTSSTPATATCTRSSVTTARSRARRSAPRSWPG